jgi:hypothetical protein
MSEGTNIIFEASQEPRQPLTRRQLLRAAALGGVVLAGGATLAACGGSSSTTATVNVTFLTNGWPGDAMPGASDQKADVSKKAYADALTKWLKKNPGVKIKHTDTTIWDQQIVTSAIAAGTAPTFYQGNVLGSYQNQQVLSAFARGLAADLTSLVQSTNLRGKLTNFYRPSFDFYSVNGKYYGTPGGYGVGDGIFYRRDLVQAAGLKEPTADWHWSDLRALAQGLTAYTKKKGAAMQWYVFDQSMAANGLASGATSYGYPGMTPVPAQPWPWKYDLAPWETQYESIVNNWRGMYFTDKSLTSSITTGDSDVAQAFARGDVAIMANNTGYFTSPPTGSTAATSAQVISNKLNKPFEDVVGWISHPVGDLGSFGATQPGSAVCSIDPHFDRNPPALAAAFDYAVSFLIGDALVEQTVAIYNANKDLKQVYQYLPPMATTLASFPGITGTAQDAWGAKTINSINAAGSIPLVPDPATYFPAEKNAGPTADAWKDANTGLAFTQDAIPSVISKLQSVTNAQFSSLSSSVSQADFTKAAKKFYSDLDAFWAKNAPEFSTQVYHPWYEQTIVPALG